MAEPQNSSYEKPSLAAFAPSLIWLREQGVGLAVIADAFETTPVSVSVTASRARKRGFEFDRRPQRLRLDVGVEPVRTLDEMWAESARIVSRVKATSNFLRGLRQLSMLRSRIGDPRSPSLLELLAECESQRAWCATHLSMTTSALKWASNAREIWRALGRDPGLAEATLTASHAWLYVNRPKLSLQLLEEHQDAREQANLPLGSEYYRQLGTAQMLDWLSRRKEPPDKPLPAFVKSLTALEHRDPPPTDAELWFAARQPLVWSRKPGVESCLEMREAVEKWKGSDSLYSAIARVYAAEAAMLLDEDCQPYKQAVDVLESLPAGVARFPLQSAVAWVLSRTPRLRLSPRLRRLWVPQVRYFNPHRRH